MSDMKAHHNHRAPGGRRASGGHGALADTGLRRGSALGRFQVALALLALGAGLAGSPAMAQLPDASGAALGLGDNFTALARGRNAVAWNPAGLAMPGNPAFSLSFAPLRGIGTIGPIAPRDLIDNKGQTLSHAVKVDWLDRITVAGQQQGSIGADLTYLSLNLGPIGLQLSSSVYGEVNLGPEAAELVLFGNAGRTGTVRPFELENSSFDLSATSTAAIGYGIPLDLIPGHKLAVGATFKYTVGHVLVRGRDDGSRFQDDPLIANIDFPVIHTDTSLSSWNNGSGYGIDLGVAWENGPLSVGLTLQNLVNTFSWDESKLFFRPVNALISADSTGSEFEALRIEDAPEPIVERARELLGQDRFQPEYALGASFDLLPILTVVGEIRHLRGGTLSTRTATHTGVGAELRLIPFLPLRGGYTLLPGGHQLSAGGGLEFGLVNLQVGVALRDSDLGQGGIGMVVFSLGGR